MVYSLNSVGREQEGDNAAASYNPYQDLTELR